MNRVTVKIANQEYTIVGDEKKEYLLQLASYVDEEMERMAQLSPRMSHSMAAVLTAINVSDALFKEKNSSKEPSQDVKSLMLDNEFLRHELIKKEQELNEMAMRHKQEGTFGNPVSVDEKNQYETQIMELERKLMESEMITIDFQNRLYDLQLELESFKTQNNAHGEEK